MEVDPATAPVVREIFEKSLRGSGLKEICKELNDRGVTNRGKRWYKGTLHYVLRNEAYTGTAVWGRTSKGEKTQDPVRVEGAWPALISRELFDDVQQAMRDRAPKVRKPARVGSRFLLSGLLKCGVCGRPYSAQGAKSGQFAYYICGTLFREGAGTCSARYLNAPRLEAFVVEKIRERILTEETIVELVTLVAEEIDAMAGELSGRLEVIEAELGDVKKRLDKLYEAIETSELTLEVLSPRIFSLRHREEQLEAAREDAETQLEQRRVELPNTEEVARYVADFRDFLQEGTIPERKALIRNFVEGIEVVGDEATLTYTVPMPNDGVTSESASVLDFVKSGPPVETRTIQTRPFSASSLVWHAEAARICDRLRSLHPNQPPRSTAGFCVGCIWSMLRRKGIRVVSITEHADDSPTGKLMEAIIESVDEFYSENLAQDVVRGMREAASRGFFLGSKAPFGYRRVKVSDGMKERPTLEVDPATAPVVKEIFESSLSGYGLKEICRTLNDRGITNRGKRWYKGGLHYLLTNEAYTGTAVWGRTTKVEKAQDPVRVEGAWPALVPRELFDAVQQAMRDRAPKVQRPGRVGSKFLLSGLLKCGVCGRPYSGQGAKSGQFAYYVCGTLFREGAGTCSARYLNAPRVEDFIVEKIRERILTEETIVELVTLVAEEIDAMAGELSGRLEVIEAELRDVRKRLERLYEALETSELTLEVLSPRIFSLRHREEQLEAAREDAETQLEQRRVELPTTEEIKGYVADFREFLQEGTFPERKALIRNFVEGIEVVGDEATLTYTVPMPKDGVKRESASVLDFVQSGPPHWKIKTGCVIKDKPKQTAQGGF